MLPTNDISFEAKTLQQSGQALNGLYSFSTSKRFVIRHRNARIELTVDGRGVPYDQVSRKLADNAVVVMGNQVVLSTGLGWGNRVFFHFSA